MRRPAFEMAVPRSGHCRAAQGRRSTTCGAPTIACFNVPDEHRSTPRRPAHRRNRWRTAQPLRRAANTPRARSRAASSTAGLCLAACRRPGAATRRVRRRPAQFHPIRAPPGRAIIRRIFDGVQRMSGVGADGRQARASRVSDSDRRRFHKQRNNASLRTETTHRRHLAPVRRRASTLCLRMTRSLSSIRGMPTARTGNRARNADVRDRTDPDRSRRNALVARASGAAPDDLSARAFRTAHRPVVPSFTVPKLQRLNKDAAPAAIRTQRSYTLSAS